MESNLHAMRHSVIESDSGLVPSPSSSGFSSMGLKSLSNRMRLLLPVASTSSSSQGLSSAARKPLSCSPIVSNS